MNDIEEMIRFPVQGAGELLISKNQKLHAEARPAITLRSHGENTAEAAA